MHLSSCKVAMGYWFLIRLSYPCSPSWNTSLHRNLHYTVTFFSCIFLCLYKSQTPFMLQLESALPVFMHPFLPSYCFSFEGKMSAPYMASHYLGLTLSNTIHSLADYSNGNTVVHCTCYSWQRQAALPIQFPGGQRRRGWDHPKPGSRCGGKRVTEQCCCPLLT